MFSSAMMFYNQHLKTRLFKSESHKFKSQREPEVLAGTDLQRGQDRDPVGLP